MSRTVNNDITITSSDIVSTTATGAFILSNISTIYTPAGTGTVGQVLTMGGSGVMTWQTLPTTNYVQTICSTPVSVSNVQTATSSSPKMILSAPPLTTSGNPVQVIVSGDANPTSTISQFVRMQLYRGDLSIGSVVQSESTAINITQAYCLQVIDTPSSGTYVYSLQVVGGNTGNYQFGEVNGPVINVIELRR
jgi:hypothetical protein